MLTTSPGCISPDAYLSDYLDLEKIDSLESKLEKDDPYKDVLRKFTDFLNGDRVSTFEDYRSYVSNLSLHLCGARHERADCSYGADSCPIKNKNIGCIHGIDFRRVEGLSSREMRVGVNIWGIQVFALAYFLHEQGYDVPLFLRNYSFWSELLNKHDKWDSNPNFLDEDLYLPNTKTMQVQERAGKFFQGKYVDPIKASFDDFWEKNMIPNS